MASPSVGNPQDENYQNSNFGPWMVAQCNHCRPAVSVRGSLGNSKEGTTSTDERDRSEQSARNQNGTAEGQSRGNQSKAKQTEQSKETVAKTTAGIKTGRLSKSTTKEGSKHNPLISEKLKPKMMGAKSMGSRYSVLEDVRESVMEGDKEDEGGFNRERSHAINAENASMQASKINSVQTLDKGGKG